ncbi:type II toxin-antitoxin system YafQ family toxin [Acidithiobacillus thiooxidans]
MTGLHHSGDWAGYRECHVKPDLLLIYRKSNTHTLSSGLQPNTACSQLTGVFGALGRILGKAPIITAWRRLKRLLLLVFIWIDHRIINPGV